MWWTKKLSEQRSGATLDCSSMSNKHEPHARQHKKDSALNIWVQEIVIYRALFWERNDQARARAKKRALVRATYTVLRIWGHKPTKQLAHVGALLGHMLSHNHAPDISDPGPLKELAPHCINVYIETTISQAPSGNRLFDIWIINES